MSNAQDSVANTVIRASAGTGKTFELSNRFIGLALDSAPDSILAATFTRKASGQILGRILVRLARATIEPEELGKLVRHVRPTMNRACCLSLLRQLVRHLHRLRVSTLDSFFVEMAQSFGLEMGLPPGWSIADEIADQSVRAEAIRTVLQDESTQSVVRLMNLLSKGEASRSVSEQIASLVKALYAVYTEAPPEAWKSLPHKKQLSPSELLAALDALRNVALAGKNFANARERDLGNVVNEDWEAFLGNGVGAKILEGSDRFGRQLIPAEVAAVYEPLVRHAKAVILGRIADQTEATYTLLERFDAAYGRLKAGKRSLRFEDVTRRLADATIADRLEEVVYRLDGQVAHLLLDEFQDTSAVQWRVLRPFAKRVISGDENRSFFCVGDVKQAIYGWRGGVAEIFDALDDEFGNLSSRALNESFRSSPAVIECVNNVFREIANNPVLQTCPAAAQEWSKRFTLHTTTKTELPGYCRLITAPHASDGEDPWAVTLRCAAEEAARLHEQSPDKSIGVLVRRNKAVAPLIFELRRRNISASEEGGNPLTDSPAVELVLSLLTLADHPGDKTARFHLARSPLGQSWGLADHKDSPAAWRLAEQIRHRLMVDGYGPTIYGWAKELLAVCDCRDAGRLEQLVELAYGYEDRATNRPSDFVALVQEKKIEDPTSARVRVMTVHQAKGLEFDIVVLAELDERIAGQPPEIVVGYPKPAARIDRVCRYVSKDLRAILPEEFQRILAAHEERVVEESLCLLYVALTRAKYSLCMVIAPSSDNERKVPSTFAGILRAALRIAAPIKPAETLYTSGDPQWWQRLEAAKPKATQEPQEILPGAVCPPLRPAQPTRGLEHRTPSHLAGDGRMNLAQLLRPARAEALHRGTLLHAWFAQIAWLDDGEPDDALLRRIACEQKLDHLDLSQIAAQFRAALQRPAVSAALRLATYRQPPAKGDTCHVFAGPDVRVPRWEWYRERRFSVRDDHGILSGAFDRLVVLYDGDQALGADILDYKTDEVRADDPQAVDVRAEIYRPQLEAYRRAASKLCRLAADQVSVRLLFIEPGVMKTL
jgi:ATP-dependent exoDNAse (exonuclease V) beta subunit